MVQPARVTGLTAILLIAFGCRAQPAASPTAAHPRAMPAGGERADGSPRTPPVAGAKEQAEVPAWIRAELGELSLARAANGESLAVSTHVVISRTRVVIEGELLIRVPDISASGRLQRVDPVFVFLKERREAWKRAHPGAEFPGSITYWIDREVPALVVKSVFQTAAFAGYPNGSFVVRRSEAPEEFARLPIGARVPGPPGRDAMGSTTVSGRLPPEVIQQRVRQNYAGLRACYEAGLGRDPALTGKVQVRFVIARDGRVPKAEDDGSTLPDAAVVRCVIARFRALRFPEPDGGIVTVVYPIVFAPD